MVRVSLVQEDSNIPVTPEDTVNDDLQFSGSEDGFEDYDEEDDFDINETLGERLVALRDVIPPNYRASISGSVEKVSSLLQSVTAFGGKSLWAITSSTLLLGVPLSLCIVAEQQLIEMEKGMQLSDSTNSLLAPGAEGGFAQPSPQAV